MEELIKILKDIKPGVDFEKENNLIEEDVLDSFDIVNLISRINDKFDISITPADIIPENFKSIKEIYELIQRLEEN